MAVTLADMREHLRWPVSKPDSEDDALMTVVAEATSVIASEVSRPIAVTSYVLDYVHGETDPILPHVPCRCEQCDPVAVLTIVAPASGVTVTRAGVLRGLTRDTEVSYSAGYSANPAWLDMAIKRMTEHLWNRTGAPRATRDPRRTAEAEPTALSYLLPYAVQSLLHPHRFKDY